MSAPYSVWIDHAGDHHYLDAQSVEEAIAIALSLPRGHFRRTRVIGDGYDAEITSEGVRETWDGLTDSEREQVEEAGL